MHEVGIVEDLVKQVAGEAGPLRRVRSVTVRRSSTFSEEALRQAFLVFSQGTPLEGADLIVETQAAPFECACGGSWSDCRELVQGHFLACPVCGRISEAPGVHDLELMEVRLLRGDDASKIS